jgi:prevent-host-death family protein
MPKAVSATEAKNRLGALLGYVVDQRDEVIVERQGKPRAVLISFTAFEELQSLREQKRRADALEDLRRLRDRVSDRNHDLSEDKIEGLAEEISQGAITRLVERGGLSFERDRR